MTAFRRLAGFILVLAASISMLITLFLLLQLWRIKPGITENLTESVDLISTTLVSTGDGLVIAADSLASAQDSVTSLGSTIDTLAESIEATGPMLVEIENLMGVELPATISSTQQSLAAAQESALIIESLLKAITSIPLFRGTPYDPEVPLYVSLGEVADNLGELPESLVLIEDSLKTTRGNLIVVKVELNLIERQVEAISTSLEDAGAVIAQYQHSVTSLQEEMTLVTNRLPGWMNTLAWLLTFVFAWLGAAQLGLLLQGWEMLTVRKELEEIEDQT